MSQHVVDFIFELIDKFSGNANKIGASALKAEKAIHQMGKAADAVDKAMAKGAAGASRLHTSVKSIDPALQSATRQLQAYGAAGEKAARQVKTLEEAHAALGRLQAREDSRQRARQNVMRNGMLAFGGYELATHLQSGLGHFLDTSNNEYMAQQKMGFAGFNDAQTRRAVSQASGLSAKYRNMSRGDVLEQMYEGVSIFGDAESSLGNVEMMTRFGSFLKAFQGGTHAGKGAGWLREAYAGVKSAEMQGALNEMDPAKRKGEVERYLKGMISMKALYGDQAKISDYLAMQKYAGASFYGMSDEFRFGFLPAMIQERGGMQTGQRLMTTYNTMNGAVLLRGKQKEALAKFGLLEGKGKGAHLPNALRDAYNVDPRKAEEMILDHIAKARHLDMNTELGRKLLRAYVPGDLAAMFPNRSTSGLFSDMFFNEHNFDKHVKAMADVKRIMEAYADGKRFLAGETKEGAETSVAAQWSNLKATIGTPMMPQYIASMNQLGDAFNYVSTALGGFLDKHPRIKEMFGKGTVMGIGGLAGLSGLAATGFGIAALRGGIGLLNPFSGGGIGLGLGAAGGAAAAGGGRSLLGRLMGGMVPLVLGGVAIAALTPLLSDPQGTLHGFADLMTSAWGGAQGLWTSVQGSGAAQSLRSGFADLSNFLMTSTPLPGFLKYLSDAGKEIAQSDLGRAAGSLMGTGMDFLANAVTSAPTSLGGLGGGLSGLGGMVTKGWDRYGGYASAAAGGYAGYRFLRYLMGPLGGAGGGHGGKMGMGGIAGESRMHRLHRSMHLLGEGHDFEHLATWGMYAKRVGQTARRVAMLGGVLGFVVSELAWHGLDNLIKDPKGSLESVGHGVRTAGQWIMKGLDWIDKISTDIGNAIEVGLKYRFFSLKFLNALKPVGNDLKPPGGGGSSYASWDKYLDHLDRSSGLRSNMRYQLGLDTRKVRFGNDAVDYARVLRNPLTGQREGFDVGRLLDYQTSYGNPMWGHLHALRRGTHKGPAAPYNDFFTDKNLSATFSDKNIIAAITKPFEAIGKYIGDAVKGALLPNQGPRPVVKFGTDAPGQQAGGAATPQKVDVTVAPLTGTVNGSITFKVDASGMASGSVPVTGAVQNKSNADRGESAAPNPTK